MNTQMVERVRSKSPEQALYRELQDDYGLSRVESRALVGRIIEYQENNRHAKREEGQIFRWVVAVGEPPGKKISDCRLVRVKLTISTKSNGLGTIVEREAAVHRLSLESYEQGGTLSQEDLSDILKIDPSTVKRIIRRLRKQNIIVPTRGTIEDIGPGISHKTKIIEFLIKGYTYDEVRIFTGHSAASIENYEKRFVKVAHFCREGRKPNEIRVLTDTSEGLVRDYLKLFWQYWESGYQSSLNGMLNRFAEYLDDKKKRLGRNKDVNKHL